MSSQEIDGFGLGIYIFKSNLKQYFSNGGKLKSLTPSLFDCFGNFNNSAHIVSSCPLDYRSDSLLFWGGYTFFGLVRMIL